MWYFRHKERHLKNLVSTHLFVRAISSSSLNSIFRVVIIKVILIDYASSITTTKEFDKAYVSVPSATKRSAAIKKALIRLPQPYTKREWIPIGSSISKFTFFYLITLAIGHTNQFRISALSIHGSGYSVTGSRDLKTEVEPQIAPFASDSVFTKWKIFASNCLQTSLTTAI